MSDITITGNEAAIDTLRERVSQLDRELQSHQHAIELAGARRDELLDLIATLSRKPRARAKPRAVKDCMSDDDIRVVAHSVFAQPCDGTLGNAVARLSPQTLGQLVAESPPDAA
jgi:hypothetical protein